MAATLAKLAGSDARVPLGAETLAVTGLTADSRQVQPGFLFAALPGTTIDGAAYIPQAIAKGATAIICAPGHSISGAAAIETANPRRLLSLMAARFFGAQPDLVVAVTGTNGKTSVASFVRQIWLSMGFRAASLGTIGVVGPEGSTYLQHTTPDPVQLHQIAAQLAEDHVEHLALEASSHGLAQYRLDGLRIAAAGFTNLTHDHLDYHASFEDYFGAKMRLFEELLPQGSPAVINMDGAYGPEAAKRAEKAALRVYGVGEKGKSLTLIKAERDGFGQRLELKTAHGNHSVYLPLVGHFQTSNALVAVGLVIASGGEEALAIHALEILKGAKGRLDLVGRTAKGAPIFIDYAHTPDALQNALEALRPYVKGKLAVVFGCGGDRDKGKRPIMGAIASKLADRVYVTDDNPRTEDAAAIRAAIMKEAKGAVEIGDRAEAIRVATLALGSGDILLVAGKGHEEGQTVGKTVIPFSDHDAVRATLGEVAHD
jgi:UDP-N-acetylmuramoyl-L-alanyl-D-glutamate--2,6-diaminopimelate ligase